VPGRAAAAPGSATPELDSTHMNGLIDNKKRSVVPTVQSKAWLECDKICIINAVSKSIQFDFRVDPKIVAVQPVILLYFASICRAKAIEGIQGKYLVIFGSLSCVRMQEFLLGFAEV